MDRWTNIANSLEQIGNPSAVPELQKRLRDDELPLGYVRSFTSAIYSLSGGSKTNSSFQQGVRFKYPYARNTKSFTVSDVRSNFVSRPKVDASTEEGRNKIWKAFSDKTLGPGFTIDGNEIVLFHGLRALPLHLIIRRRSRIATNGFAKRLRRNLSLALINPARRIAF